MPAASQSLRARKLHRAEATSSVQPIAKRTANAPERALDYPDRGVPPMTSVHLQAILNAIPSLRSHYTHRDDVYVGGELTMYWLEGDNQWWVLPDVFVAFGPHPGERDVWKAWEEGKFADFVLEVASKGTHRRDQTEKHAIYESLGVEEYWQHDPTGKYLPPRLLGHRLNKAGVYEPVPSQTKPDGTVYRESKVLSLHLCLDREGCLRLYDPATGEFLATNEEKDDLLAEERRRHAEERRALLAEIAALKRRQADR
ncbi:MAG: Uma2 family endonuclease [Gammaproteobacteria bacterium]|nr:Uma2 family endonuclease [Gammaproteobacteria bacterium]